MVSESIQHCLIFVFKHKLTCSCSQFNALGINWTGTLVGCVATVLAPIPVIFYLYGHRIRAKSKFAPKGLPDDESDWGQ